MRNELTTAVEQLPSVTGIGGDVQISNSLGKLLNLTDKLAQKRQDKFISSEIFLLAACEEKGQLRDILKNAGIVRDVVEKTIENIR